MLHQITFPCIIVASLALLFTSVATVASSTFNADNNEPTIHRRLSDVSEYDSEKSMDVLARLLQMKSHTRKLDEKKHECGVVLFYHIPGTDGTSIKEWLKQIKDANNADYISSVEDASFVDTVRKNIQRLNGWKIIYAQDNSLSSNSNESLLQEWRDTVINQQCQFVATTMFADTIDHSVSHTYKKLAGCNCTPEEFKERGYDMDDEPWRSQLDYFLFNNGEVEEMDPKDKVKKGMTILKQHFDLVLLNNREKFVDTVLKVTGWSSPGPLAKKVHGELIFTKDLVSKYNKLVGKNGDGDFIDAVGHIYNNDLGYLFSD